MKITAEEKYYILRRRKVLSSDTIIFTNWDGKQLPAKVIVEKGKLKSVINPFTNTDYDIENLPDDFWKPHELLDPTNHPSNWDLLTYFIKKFQENSDDMIPVGKANASRPTWFGTKNR